jgi:predicted dehydrogenase
MSAQDLRVLLAGCGSIGRRHARVLRSLGVRDIRICDPQEAQRQALKAETTVTAEFDSYEKALSDRPDAVFVLTPPKLHIPMTIQALRTGAHVFCEKPLAGDLDGVPALREALAAAKRKFMVGFCFRYHEGLTLAKARLEEGRIGRLVSIRCRMGEHLPTVRPDYRTLFTSQYSGAFDLTHEIDLACWYAGGAPITTVKSLYGKFSDVDMRAPDTVEILVRFGRSCLASIHLDFFSQPRTRVTELLGAEGALQVEFASWDECTVSQYTAAEKQWRHETLRTERDHMFRSEVGEFLAAVAEGRPIRLGLDEALKSLHVLCAAQKDGAMESME